jgi:hypothetical protein
MVVGHPTIVGDTVLSPGTYYWRLIDSPSNRNIVQITNRVTGHVEATIFGISNYRQLPSNTHELDFWETPKGLPRAVHAWFRPGENYGQEFAYPTKLLATFVRNAPNQAAVVDHVSVAAAPHKARISVVGSRMLALLPQHSPRQHPEGSWAVITNGVTPKPIGQRSGVWAGIRHWSLAATVLPLVGLAGLIALIFYLLSHSPQTSGAHRSP